MRRFTVRSVSWNMQTTGGVTLVTRLCDAAAPCSATALLADDIDRRSLWFMLLLHHQSSYHRYQRASYNEESILSECSAM